MATEKITSEIKNQPEIYNLYDRYRHLEISVRHGKSSLQDQKLMLELRDEIAQILNRGGNEAERFIDFIISKYSRKFKDRSLACIADAISANLLNSPSKRRLSPIFETIVSSSEIIRVTEEFERQIRGYGKASFMCGSSVYALNYNIKHSSDLDIIIIADDEEIKELSKLAVFGGIANLENEVDVFIESEYSDLSFKFDFMGKKVTPHFLKKCIFERICNWDFIIDKPDIVTLKKYLKPNANTDNDSYRFSFDGCPHIWNSYETKIANGVHCEIPLFGIDENGKFVNSPLIDRIVVSSQVSGDTTYFQRYVENLKQNLRLRMQYEVDQNLTDRESVQFANIGTRHQFFPPYYRKGLNQISN